MALQSYVSSGSLIPLPNLTRSQQYFLDEALALSKTAAYIA
jgi:hypothetical protein